MQCRWGYIHLLVVHPTEKSHKTVNCLPSNLAQKFVHGLVSQLYAQERCRIRGHRSGKRRPEAWEESLYPTVPVDTADRAADRGSPLRTL